MKGYEGLYKVSNLGRVKRTKTNRILKNRLSTQGYIMVTLCKKSKPFNASVHRLIAEVFIENPLNKEQINHINGIKHDNRIENLEWVTSSENMVHAYETGLKTRESCARYGKRKPLTVEQKEFIAIKTKEAMRNPIVREKIRVAMIGKKRGGYNVKH